MVDLNRYYDYEYIKTLDFIDDGEKWHQFIYRFKSDKNIYYARISYPEYDGSYFTIDFLEEDRYSDYDNFFDIEYKDLNQYDSMKVISTVFKIIKDYYEINKDILESFGFNATEKRSRIYKYVISKIFPTWILESDKEKDGYWITHYRIV